jgi:hypothetical protein
MTDNPPERVGAIERKLDALSSSADERFDAIDKRFDAIDKRFDAVDTRFKDVTAAIVEQREYTEFAFALLRREIIARFERVERNMATRDQLERMRLGTAEYLQRLETRFESLEQTFDGLGGKLDRFIDEQTRRRRRPRRSKKA